MFERDSWSPTNRSCGVIVDHELVREVVLRPPLTVGRAPENDVMLDDEAVSALHGRIERSHGRWRFTDVGSSNGTLVALTALACAPESHRDIVLITVDTLRADHVGLYGYERPTTPELAPSSPRDSYTSATTRRTPVHRPVW